MKRSRGACFALAFALLAGVVVGPAAAAAPPGSTFYVAGIRLSPTAPFEGDNLTILVDVVNNASTDIMLSNVTLTVAAAGSGPELVGQQENITVMAASNATLEFHWVAAGGTRTFTAQASVRQGNASIPLPPATLRATVEKPQIQEPLAVAAGIGAVLLTLLLLATGPALVDAVLGGRARRPRDPRMRADDDDAPETGRR